MEHPKAWRSRRSRAGRRLMAAADGQPDAEENFAAKRALFAWPEGRRCNHLRQTRGCVMMPARNVLSAAAAASYVYGSIEFSERVISDSAAGALPRNRAAEAKPKRGAMAVESPSRSQRCSALLTFTLAQTSCTHTQKERKRPESADSADIRLLTL